MNKTAVYALLLALMVPLLSYFIIKKLSDKAINMPPRYYPDSIIEKTVDGKLQTDTVWHRLPEISMINHMGQEVGWQDMMKDSTGKIISLHVVLPFVPH